jgi:hypothetical protein
MGARIAFARASALHDSNRWLVSLEFSLAAIISSDPRDLRCGDIAHGGAVKDCSYHCACPSRFDRDPSVNLPNGWFLRFAA